MNYLYGDSTASKLKSNFLEFLRDAIDFSVFVLEADARMKQGKKQAHALTEASDVELARLERFIASVQRAVESGEKGDDDSPTAACGERLMALIDQAHHASIDGVRKNLAAALAQIDAEETAGRDACVRALGTLLAPHEPPDATTTLRLKLRDNGRYDATLDGAAEPALTWTLEVAVPDGHAWASPMRVDRHIPQLEIRAPQLGGWITKEVKVKPLRIERYVVTQLVDSGTLDFELRSEPTSGIGFDFKVDIDKSTVRATRVGLADDASVGKFDLQVEDVPLVVELAKKLRASLAGVERRPNIHATFEEADFRALPTYVDFIQRLVAMMAPIVREIAQRSLTPTELILRRQLSNDRREEIFVAKATLRDKLAVLPPASRTHFTPLGLDITGEIPKVSAPSEPPAIRSELPPSLPRAANGSTIQPPSAVAPPANPPVDDAPQIEVGEEDLPADLADEPRSSKTEGRNEALVVSLKKIQTLSKNGRAEEAYQEYNALFGSKAFADYRPEDQRQALKLMVLASSHPARKETVATAHRAALGRLKALVAVSHEPADQELLGVTLLYLGDEKSATAAFQAGLDRERTKNPQSELVATLMRRISAI